jgi:hypothetical protein
MSILERKISNYKTVNAKKRKEKIEKKQMEKKQMEKQFMIYIKNILQHHYPIYERIFINNKSPIINAKL